MTLWENFLTISILIALFIIVYCKMKRITFKDFISELKDLSNLGGIAKNE